MQEPSQIFKKVFALLVRKTLVENIFLPCNKSMSFDARGDYIPFNLDFYDMLTKQSVKETSWYMRLQAAHEVTSLGINNFCHP